jgi:hypothetical protein
MERERMCALRRHNLHRLSLLLPSPFPSLSILRWRQGAMPSVESKNEEGKKKKKEKKTDTRWEASDSPFLS